MSGIHAYSAPADELVIFSVDDHALMNDLILDESLKANRLIGSYKGEIEHSYMLTKEAFDNLCASISGWHLLANQESVLLLGIPEARGWRKASLMFRNGNQESLGVFKSCTEEEAKAGDYTYDPARNLYWNCEVDPPTSQGMAELLQGKKAVQQLADFVIAAKKEGYCINPDDDLWDQVFNLIKDAYDETMYAYDDGYADGVKWARQQTLRATQEGDFTC